MGQQPLLAGEDQIRRHGEQPVRTRLLGELREPDRQRGAVSGARHDGHLPGGLLDGRADDEAELLRCQGVELARTAAGEDGRRSGVDAPAHMRTEDIEVDGTVRPVGGDGEEERPGDSGESGGEWG